MKFSKIKVSKEIGYGVLVFLFFSFIFSFCRLQIYSLNTWLFAMTGEIQQIKFADEAEAPDSKQAKDSTKKTDNRTAEKSSSKSLDSDRPVKSNLPLTPQTKIQVLPSLEDVDEGSLEAFPELRSYTGAEWREEKTVIKMATDGQLLYASFLCYDSNPENLVTKYSEAEGSAMAWKDDSIEFFIMNDKDSDHYYQLISSASGLNHIYYMRISTASMTSYSQDADLPEGFKKPYMRSEICPEGFKVTMEINLESFGFDKLDNDKEILIQVVRNYRDVSDPKKAELQLFPGYIYADNRTGKQNHDRRTFIAVKASK